VPGGLSVTRTSLSGAITGRRWDVSSAELAPFCSGRRSGEGDSDFEAGSLGTPERHSHGDSGAKRPAPSGKRAIERSADAGRDLAAAGSQQHADPSRLEQQPPAA